MIELKDCKKGFVYTLRSRNLLRGVFNGRNGFIGIREKFGSEYLFTEYHYDTGTYGTAKPLTLVEEIPSWIPLSESLGSICRNCGRVVKSIPLTEDPRYVRWEHVPYHILNEKDEVTLFEHTCEDVRPMSLSNPYLFDFLKAYEKTS